MTSDPRGHRRYVTNNRRLRDTLPPICTWCGHWIDYSLPNTDPMGWTTDHTVPLIEGGDLFGDRTLMHRRCNTIKENERRAAQPKLQTTRDW